jgi:Spy/CpxP family protein refolding chaperone
MKNETKLRDTVTILTLVLLLAGAWAHAKAQGPTTQNPVDPPQIQTNQANQIPDLRPLNLTPDQLQKIRDINSDMKEQRQTAGLKVRQARRALDEAVESPTPNQALIEQRSRELADAQAGMIRVRSLVESRVLQEVLTPEQRLRLREMRQRNQALRRGANQQRSGGGLRQRQQGLPRNVNAQPGQGSNQRKLTPRQPKP